MEGYMDEGFAMLKEKGTSCCRYFQSVKCTQFC